MGFSRKPLQILHSPFITHHSSLIIHHSSLIIFSISTSPKFLRSPFFQTAKLLLDWKNLDKNLQISSVSDFEKTPISQVFLKLYSQNLNPVRHNCLLTQDF